MGIFITALIDAILVGSLCYVLGYRRAMKVVTRPSIRIHVPEDSNNLI